MKIYIGSDHGGFELKKEIIEFLSTENFEVQDCGPFELVPDDDYPVYAFNVAKEVLADKQSLGILICRSGSGVCIAANKVKGIYAALCFSKEHAEKAREHNNANVLCLDADFAGEDPKEIAKTFLNTNFAGWESRHGRRVKQIVDFENNPTIV